MRGKGGVCGPNGVTLGLPFKLLVKDRREDFLMAVKTLLGELGSTGDSKARW